MLFVILVTQSEQYHIIVAMFITLKQFSRTVDSFLTQVALSS